MGSICLAMNLDNGAIVNYHNFRYRCMAAWNGSAYLGNEDGLTEYGPQYNDDDGTDIDAFAEFVDQDFETPNRKRIRGGSVRHWTDGALSVSWTADGRTESTQQVLPEVEDDTPQNIRIKGDRSAEGTYLRLKVANVGGADFTIEEINLDLEVLPIGKSKR